jgi:hypothetical protein
MGANEFYQHPAIGIGDMDDEPEFVAAQVKDQPVIGHEINLVPNIVLTSAGPVHSTPLTRAHQIRSGTSAAG